MRAVLTFLDAFAPDEVEMAIASLIEPEVPIKRLLLLLEMARQGAGGGGASPRIPIAHWNAVLRDLATG